MQQILLNDAWSMRKNGEEQCYSCSVPCSVYHTLQQQGVIENPYYRENEMVMLPISEDDYVFSRSFPMPAMEEGMHCDLCFDGIDTIENLLDVL